MLAEHREVERLISHLRELVTGPTGSRAKWLTTLCEAFKEFRARVHRHFELEEHDGYLESVQETRPTLAPQIALLQSEHRQLEPLLGCIEQILCSAGADDHLLTRDTCNRINDLLDYVKAHEVKEHNMVSETYATDLGAAD